MARTRKSQNILAADVQKLEGLIQELQGTDPEWRPDTLTHLYIANHLGVSSRKAQLWIRGAKKAARNSDTADAFVDCYNKIADLLSEHLSAMAYKMAKDPGNRNAFNAQKWLLAKINPALFGDEPEQYDDADVSTVAGIDQVIFDEMTEEEIASVDALQQTIADAMAECGGIVEKVQHRVHSQQISDRAVH